MASDLRETASTERDLIDTGGSRCGSRLGPTQKRRRGNKGKGRSVGQIQLPNWDKEEVVGSIDEWESLEGQDRVTPVVADGDAVESSRRGVSRGS